MIEKEFKIKLETILKKNFVYSKARQKIIEEVLEVFSNIFKKSPPK